MDERSPPEGRAGGEEGARQPGPSGFVLARRLRQLGVECTVMSPSKTERKPNEKVKIAPSGHPGVSLRQKTDRFAVCQ